MPLSCQAVWSALQAALTSGGYKRRLQPAERCAVDCCTGWSLNWRIRSVSGDLRKLVWIRRRRVLLNAAESKWNRRMAENAVHFTCWTVCWSVTIQCICLSKTPNLKFRIWSSEFEAPNLIIKCSEMDLPFFGCCVQKKNECSEWSP